MGEEENKYVSQLKDVFNSCDATGTGYLDKEELTELCRKLHLERQLPLLLDALLGNDLFARVNFEEFKEGFVTILSSSISLGLSDDESSYLEPAVPDEVEPKYIHGAKWYGRRTRPELQGANLETPKLLQEQQAKANGKSQLRRSASLESVESLKSDEEAESTKEQQHEMFEGQGRRCTWHDDLYDSPRKVSPSCFGMTENQVRDIWEDLGIGKNGHLNKQELATVCKNIGLKEMEKEDLEDLFNQLDSDGDGRVSLKEFQLGLFNHSPILCPISSTPLKPRCQRSPSHQIFKDRSTTPSFLSTSVALNLFSSIDDGSGFARPEQVVSIWAQEGVENCKEILKSLDFNMEERVNLLELSAALDEEITVPKSGLQQATFASYRHELRHLEAQVEQISIERDKARVELEKVEKRKLQLFEEVDDHNSALEHHNESKMKDLEQDYRGKLSVMKSEAEMEKEQLLQQGNHQKTKLEADIRSLQEEESSLRQKLSLVIKENSRLQSELVEVVQKLSESEKQVLNLQKDLDFMLKDKLGLLDPHSTELFDQEERFAKIIQEYELQCRELRDKNDELQMEVEKLRSQLHESKHSLAWCKMKASRLGERLLPENVKARILDTMQKDEELLLGHHHFPVAGQNGLVFIESGPYSVSIEMELLVEELKEQHQDLKIQLETKVNYYEREIELMKRNFEKERKDVEQGFKIEISELEEQKSDLEELNAKCQEVIDGLKDQLQKLVPTQELKKSFEKERSEMEQYYAKEISILGQRLAQERDRLEEDMKMKHEAETHFMRKHIDELMVEKEKVVHGIEELNQLNKHYEVEIFQLNARIDQLSHELSELSSDNNVSRNTISLLNRRLVELESQRDHEAAVARQFQEAAAELTKEHLQEQLAWQGEKALLEQQLKAWREKASQSQELEAELERSTQECQMLRLTKAQLREEVEECQDRLLEANTSLNMAKFQHSQELEELKGQAGNSVPKACLAELEKRLADEQNVVRQLQGEVNSQAKQMRWQAVTYQEEHENSHRLMEEKVGELERNLKNVQTMLQEKVAELKEQFEKNAKSNLLLKDLYVENAQLMKTLQVTEQRQKSTDNRNLILEEKISSLNKLVREITLASQ
ncbi:ninein-like protein isoform X3 [Zootoca vivipara]|uniref:ninein-like protein isoform X3 n=1 Tax=Zootoca vivipara TaxID=8524 RepID=UPI00293C0788|nr:ninein-like protein isoform X3 [Zootoca vivipara]